MEFDYQSSTLTMGEAIEFEGKRYCVVAYTDMGDYLKLFCMGINSNETRSLTMNIPKYMGMNLYENIRNERLKQEGPKKVIKTAFEIDEEMRLKYSNINITKKLNKNESTKGKRSNDGSTKSRKSKNVM